VNSTDFEYQGILYSNIILTGGNVLFPGFKDRLYSELRAITPMNFPITIVQPEDPISFSWKGGVLFASANNFSKLAVSKAEYEENGNSICKKKFSINP